MRPSPGCGAPLPSIPTPGHSHNIPFRVIRDISLALAFDPALGTAPASAPYPYQVEDPIQGPVSRSYRVHLPLHWPGANDIPLPLLLDYHGWTSHAGQQRCD